MKRIISVLIIALSPSLAWGQSVNDLVQVWLAQAGKVSSSADYTTCQPEGQPDGICSWSTSSLGPQPTTAQLQALVPTWRNIQQATQYQAKLDAGLGIVSSSTPALNGTYSVDDTAQAHIVAIVTSINAGQGLPHGASTVAWLDKSGVTHNFTSAQFVAFGAVARDYAFDLVMTKEVLQAGGSASWPSATALIP